MRGTIGVLACLMVARLAVGMKGGRPIRAEEHRYLVGIQQNNVTWCVGVILDPLRVILPDDCLRKSPLIEVTEADVVPLVNGNPPRKYKGRFSLSDSGQIYTELDVVVIHIDHPGMELAESIDQNDFPSSASISKKKPTPTDSIVIGQRRVGVMTILEDSECFQQIGTLYFPMNDRLQSIKLMLGEKLMCAVRTNFTMSIGDIPPGQACPQDLGAPVIQDDEVIGLLTWSSSRNDSKLALVMQIRENGEIPKGQPIKNCHPVGLCSTNTSEAFASADDRRVVRQIRAARQAVDNADIQDGTTSRTTWKGLLFSVSVELQSSSVSEIRKRYNLPTYQNGVNSQFATNGEFNYERLPESGRWGSGVYGSVKGRDGARQPEAAEFSREPYYVPSRGGNQPTNVRGGSNNGNYVPPTLDLSSSFDIRNPWPQNQYGYQYFPPEDIARQPDGPATHQRTVDSKNPINLPPNRNGNQYFPPGDIVRQPADPATYQSGLNNRYPYNSPSNQYQNQYLSQGNVAPQSNQPTTHRNTYKIRLLHNSPQYGDQIPQQNVSIDGLRNRGGGADNIQYPYVTQDSRYDFYRVQLKPHRAVNQTVDSYLNYTNMNSTNGIGQIQSPGFVNTTFPHSSLSNGAASERKRTNCTERNGFCTSKTGDSAIKRLINDLLKNNVSEVAQKLAGISSSQMIELIWHLEKATDIASEVQRKVDQSGSSPDFTSDDYLKLLWAVQSVKNSGSRRNNYLRELFNPGKLHGEGGGGRALFEDYDGNSTKLMTVHDRYSVDDDKIFPPEDNEVPPKPNKIAHVQHKSSSRVLLVKSVHQYLLVLTSLTLFL